MPAKKTASKNAKRAGGSRKKTAKKAAARKKSTATKRKVKAAAKKPAKKAAGKKASKKKTSKKKASKKAAARRKTTARKSTAKKKPAKKTARKATRKKATARKASTKHKASAKKAGARKSSKKVTKKSTSRKKAATAKKASTKKASKKKAASSRPSAKKTSAKRAAPQAAKRAPAKKPAGRAAANNKPTRQDLLSGPIHGIEPYKMKRGEEYMSPQQLEHFQAILMAWKRELMDEVDRTVHHMQDEAANFPDPNDRATQESEFGLELRTRDRERKLLRKIDQALARIEDGTYGYCEETGEEIGLKRLEARPVATLCLEAQERREMAERQFRDRDDRYR